MQGVISKLSNIKLKRKKKDNCEQQNCFDITSFTGPK